MPRGCDDGVVADQHKQLVTNTRLGLDRLTFAVSKLTPAELSVALPHEWTVSVALAHLSFWDQWVVARWQSIPDRGSERAIEQD
jgi:hypothetical protein